MDEVVKRGGSVVDPDNWNRLNDTLAQFPSVVERIVREAVKPSAPPVYETRYLQLPVGGVVPLFDYNAARIRFYVNPLESVVAIGNLSTLGEVDANGYYNGGGYVIDTTTVQVTPLEMKTVAPVWIKNLGTSTAVVAVWAEYSAD